MYDSSNNLAIYKIIENRDHLKVGCSSLYIIIYNAIEYAFRQSLNLAHSEIQRGMVGYVELTDYWRQQYIRSEYLHSLREGCNFASVLDKIAQNIDGDTKYKFQYNLRTNSFNIGHRDIWTLIKAIDLPFEVDIPVFNADVEMIRARRNALSHGDDSFLSVGEFVSIDDVVGAIDRVEGYFGEFIKNFETYVSERRYLRR